MTALHSILPSAIPAFGAVYFRKSNPPAVDWARDHARAVADGHTLLRHWVIWNAVEIAPGVFDWDDYDRMLDLSAANGIRVVLGEMLIDYPEWLVTACPDGRAEMFDGRKRWSEMHTSCATGGHAVMCLDHAEVRDRAENFLRMMARRYRGHPALHAYDVWNECTVYGPERFCYCPHTEEAFRRWLRVRYGDDVRAVGRAWRRHSLSNWQDVRLPRAFQPYPDSLDATRFYNDNYLEQLRWRVATLRSEDPEVIIAAHGNARSFADLSSAANDDYRAACEVDLWGYTYYYGTQCPPLMAADITRGAADGKPFWRAEAVGDHDWQNRNHAGNPDHAHDRMHEPAEIRLDALISLAGGATAYQNPRWRPLLDGPLFAAFGWYDLDGQPTERSAEVALLAAWAREPALAPLWAARPVAGEVGLLLIPEAQDDVFCRHGRSGFYGDAFIGAWQAWRDAGVATDIARLPQLEPFRVVYVPFAAAVSDATLARLRAWVEAGGTLIAEAPFAFFNDHAHCFTVNPNRGWAGIVGADSAGAEFAPDRLERFVLATTEGDLPAAIYRQSWHARSAEVLARHENGATAAISHAWGKGCVVLLGGSVGWAYKQCPTAFVPRWLMGLIPPAPHEAPFARSLTSGVVARLWRGPTGLFLWLINETRDPIAARIHLSTTNHGPVIALRGGAAEFTALHELAANVPGRDALVFQFT